MSSARRATANERTPRAALGDESRGQLGEVPGEPTLCRPVHRSQHEHDGGTILPAPPRRERVYPRRAPPGGIVTRGSSRSVGMPSSRNQMLVVGPLMAAARWLWHRSREERPARIAGAYPHGAGIATARNPRRRKRIGQQQGDVGAHAAKARRSSRRRAPSCPSRPRHSNSTTSSTMGTKLNKCDTDARAATMRRPSLESPPHIVYGRQCHHSIAQPVRCKESERGRAQTSDAPRSRQRRCIHSHKSGCFLTYISIASVHRCVKSRIDSGLGPAADPPAARR